MAVKAKTAEALKFGDEAVTVGKDAMEAALKAGEEAATKAYSMGKERFDAATKSFGELTAFNQETVELMVQTSTKAAKAFEAISAEMVAFSKARVDESVAAAKAAMTAKTLKELLDIQTGFVKDSVETLVQHSTKMGEMGQKVVQEAIEPVGARFKLAVEKFGKPVAA